LCKTLLSPHSCYIWLYSVRCRIQALRSYNLNLIGDFFACCPYNGVFSLWFEFPCNPDQHIVQMTEELLLHLKLMYNNVY
jgi:hypothetical protein